MNRDDFQALVRQAGQDLYRDMPWRTVTSPYFILVSELMLQQTQVERVIPKFTAFMEYFPDVVALASASQAEVLRAWSGLGYNRRAMYLHQAAKKIATDFGGVIPPVRSQLLELPGVGPSTSAAILAYSFDQPVVFIETNIRTVYFHHYFADATIVHDKELLATVRDTLDHAHPRQWYWALMDYGNHLKRAGMGRINQSA
ncbi:MAG: A/G-specific adenine glycosylase, partial [Candidatus Saccharibacteria bacterium]